VLINYESSVGAFLLVALLLLYLVIITLCILFIPALVDNHKCTQPCYFPLLYKTATQKVKMDWNYLTRSSRLGASPVVVPVVLWSLPLFCFIRESS
jgi:hypothetical protein